MCVAELEDGREGGGKRSCIKELAGGSSQEDWWTGLLKEADFLQEPQRWLL